MPIVNDYTAVCEVYQELRERGIAMPTFNAEDRESCEAILAAGLQLAEEYGVPDLPIAIGWTSRYPARGQATKVTACGNALLGNDMLFADLEAFAGPHSPYRHLRILPHLDHAFPWLDADVFEHYINRFSAMMFDASEKPLAENTALTAAFTEKVKGRVLVEAAVDEIKEAGDGGGDDDLTTAAQAKEFVSATGVDIIVPNVGTEHRMTGASLKYHRDLAQSIRDEVGTILCMHGSSSVQDDLLVNLPSDGFVKINVYTTIAVHGGQALAQHTLHNLGRVFDDTQLQELIDNGILHPDYRSTCGITSAQPSLEQVCNPLRRDAWVQGMRDRCLHFFRAFGYEKFSL